MIKRHLYWVIIILFFTTCARQSSPTGGPKDTIPPRLINADPAHKAINFKGKTIELTFSEFIALNNPKEQLIVTPTIGKDYEVKAKKNKVTVEIPQGLKDSTTYTLNFRDAVQDITEKNPAKNLLLAISTGSYLDSLSIDGKVFDLLKGTEMKEVTVAINHINDTFNIFKHPAVYFTKSNDKGQFKIDYLKPDIYDVYAIEDRNRNLVADTRTEYYGFLKTPLFLNNDTSNITIGLLKLDARPLKVTSARPYNTYFNIKASKNLKSFELKSPDSSKVYYSLGEDNANIKVYNNLAGKDSIGVRLTAKDSIGNTLDTLVYAKFLTRDATKEKFNVALSDTRILSDKGVLQAKFTFTKPVTQISFDSLYFKKDSLTLLRISDQDLTWNQTRTEALLKKPIDKTWFATPEIDDTPVSKKKTGTQPVDSLKEKQLQPKNELFTGIATFISIENDSSKKIIQKINPQKTEDLSQIFFDIKTQYKSLIVQLLSKEYKILREIRNRPKGQFDDLEAGDYLIRVIIDADENGEWTPGNYFKKEEPEKIYYVKNEAGAPLINLKTNWEYETTLLISQ
jgi:hypothetical protein